MPPIRPNPPALPQTDPEWEALPDDELDVLPDSQRLNSERIAREEQWRVRREMAEARGERAEQLALNLEDLDRVDPLMYGKALQCRLPQSPDPIRIGSEVAVALVGDLLEAALVCDVLRSHNRELEEPIIRVYLKRRGWRRLPANAVLTIPVDSTGSKCVLNPEYFPTSKPLVPLAPLGTRRVEFGKPLE